MRCDLLWVRVLLTALAALTLAPAAGGAQPKKRYNILFLFSDDHRRDTIAALGNPHIVTPNLDRLANSGTSFTRAYIMGSMSGAVCMPSRAMLMTGRHLFRAPLQMQDAPVLGEVLRRAGYVTYGVGKWHNGPDSFLRSFDRGEAVMLGGMADHFNVPVSRRRGDKLERYDAKGKHSSELFADAAIAFLKEHAANKAAKGSPFFLYVAFTAAHDPRDPPKKYAQMYYKKNLPLPKNFLPQHPFNLASDMTGRDEVLAPWPRPKEMIRDQLAEYYGLITHLDEQIGRILQALRDIGEYENTLIVFAADNGLALGSHGLLGKQSVYEHSVGVPLIFVGPGVPANERRDALVYLFDLFPTLCEMNGIEPPQGLDGTSLVGVLQGKQGGVRDTLYFNYTNLQRGVRDDRWKLIVYPKINYVQLFDMKSDPDEMLNLAARPEQAERVVRMKKLILAWEEKLGAGPMPLTVADPLPRGIDLSGRQRQADQWQPQWIRKKYFGETAP